MDVNTIESKLLLFCKNSKSFTLFNGSGFSVFGELFKEYILLSINSDKISINLKLCDKIDKKLSDFESKYCFNDLKKSKEFLQLLCFYLSYRNFFNFFKYSSNFTRKLLQINTISYLNEMGCGSGSPGSGNFAMFYAIIVFNETRDPNDLRIINWFNYMDMNINSDGFWGNKHITYALQNGYHQYEIYNFFKKEPPVNINIKKILNSQDSNGHFGPFSGGGGCFDFDTVDLIYKIDNSDYNERIDLSLLKLYNNLILEQQLDGGFSESPYITDFKNTIAHIFIYTIKNFNIPRLKFFVRTLLSFGRNLILPTHWSSNHRKYNQSDTWNSWFRLLTIYKINNRIYKKTDKSKIFPFPGIAFK
jgi:hypothetical protein